MGNSHCRVRGIHTLTAMTGGAIHINPQILRVNGHIHLFRLRQYRHGTGGCLSLARCVRYRNPLNPVHAAFVFQLCKAAIAHHREYCFLHATQLGRAFRNVLHFKAVPLCIPGVHAQKICTKEACFLATCTGTNLHHNISVVIRILRQQQNPQFLLHGILCLLQCGNFFLCHIRKLRILKHVFRFLQVLLLRQVFLPCCHGRLQGCPFLQHAAILGLIGNDLALCHGFAELSKAVAHLLKFRRHVGHAIHLVFFAVIVLGMPCQS